MFKQLFNTTKKIFIVTLLSAPLMESNYLNLIFASEEDTTQSSQIDSQEADSSHLIYADDFKTDSNTWADAIELAFQEAEAIYNESVTVHKGDLRQMSFGAYGTVTITPGEYVIDRTIQVGDNSDFDFTGSHFYATEGEEQTYDCFDAVDMAHYNHYRMPSFHNFRRNLVFSTENNDAVILIEGGGSYGSLNHIDSVNYHSSRSTTLTIRDFEVVDTQQALRLHEDNVLVENATIGHNGYNGSAIFNQGRTRIENVSFVLENEPENPNSHFGLVESWTTSEPEQLINPATGLIEDEDPLENYNPGKVGAVNRSISLHNITVEGDIPLVVWEGENWQNFSHSNAFNNAIEIKDIEYSQPISHPLIVINRDLPNMVLIERINENSVDTDVPLIEFTELSMDTEYQYHTDNIDNNDSIDEHNNIYNDSDWQYEIYLGEGLNNQEYTLSNDDSIERFVSVPYPVAVEENAPDSIENELNLYDLQLTRSGNIVNATEFKTDDIDWSTAINQALESASQESAYDERTLVVLSPAVYVINETVRIPDNVDIDFSGSIFMSLHNQRVDFTAIEADIVNNMHTLPGIIGFDTGFSYSFNGQDGQLLIERGYFFNNRIDLTDTGFAENRYGQVHLEGLRSTASETHIVTNAKDTLYKGSWIYQSSVDAPSIISNSRFKLTNFVGVPFRLNVPTQETIAWVAQYNEGEGITQEEKYHRGAWLDNGVFGGEPGSRVLIRSYMEKAEAPSDSNSLGNHMILSYIVGEAGNQATRPQALITIENELNSYVKLETINGMTTTLEGIIHFQPDASMVHQESSGTTLDYIIYKNNTANISYPSIPYISSDETIESLVFSPMKLSELNGLEQISDVFEIGRDKFAIFETANQDVIRLNVE